MLGFGVARIHAGWSLGGSHAFNSFLILLRADFPLPTEIFFNEGSVCVCVCLYVN